MAEPDRFDSDQIRTMGMNGNDADNRLQPQNNDDPTVDEDSYSECWDDAKALLNNDDGNDGVCADFRDGFDDMEPASLVMNKSNQYNKQPLTLSHDTVDGLVAPLSQTKSSSQAYSSIKSNNNDSNDNRTTTALSPPTGNLSSQCTLAKTTPLAATSEDLILHEAVFNNDIAKIMTILDDEELVKRKELVNKRDKHGNTALHLACIMGRSPAIVKALLHSNKHGFKWSIDVKNLNRWTPFHEACSYGNREIITLMAEQLKDDVDDALHNSKLSDFLEKTRDYRLVLKWEFQSWVPFVSRVLPSDVCVIVKHGKYVRIDTRLLDFEGLFRKKGDSCLVYSNKKWIVMDNKARKYQYFETPTVYKDIDEKVDEFMSTDIMDLELKSSEMQLTRSTSGWIWKADKVGKVGRFNAALYDLNNVFLVTRKRREHLSEEDLKRNKNAYKSAVHVFKFGEKPNHQKFSDTRNEDGNDNVEQGQSGDEDGEEEEDEEVIHRDSLAPPRPANVTWQQYLQAESGNHPTLGREQKCKLVKTAVKASVAMSEEFPLSKSEFLDLLSIVPIKMFRKLKEFVEMKLPEGFPVRLDIPVFPFLTARITFEDFAFHDGPTNESLFTLPQGYELDTNLLPGRFRNSNNNNTLANNESS